VGVDVYILLIFTIVLGELEADAAPVEVGSFLILLKSLQPESCFPTSSPSQHRLLVVVNPLPLAG